MAGGTLSRTSALELPSYIVPFATLLLLGILVVVFYFRSFQQPAFPVALPQCQDSMTFTTKPESQLAAQPGVPLETQPKVPRTAQPSEEAQPPVQPEELHPFSRRNCSKASRSLDEILGEAEKVFDANMQRRAVAKVRRKTERISPENALRAYSLLPSYPCPLEERFGHWGEGGKWVCRKHRCVNPRPVVISIGSNGQTDFEEALNSQLNAFSHTFDFTLSPGVLHQVESLPFLKFYAMGLTGQQDMEALLKAFPGKKFILPEQLLTTINESYVDLFKIDCEGCEVSVVDDMGKIFTRDTVPFGQILMEIHKVDTVYSHLERLVETLEDLGYRIFHSEINPLYLQGYELAFVHESLVKP